MGFWTNLLGLEPASTATTSMLSPFTPQDSLAAITVADLFHGATVPTKIDAVTALRIPAVKRAHDVTCTVLAKLPWRQYAAGGELMPEQPKWLSTSASGIAPRGLRWGVASDQFMHGWAAIGFEIGANGYPMDALHIPFGWWKVTPEGTVIITDPRVPLNYRHLVIALPIGYASNGILNDGIDTLRDARAIAAAYRDRIDNPIAQTILSVAADRWDGWSRGEREEFRKLWIAGRQAENGATAMKPDWVTVDIGGAAVSAPLFESGRNANRLDIANHAGLPASLLEGSKQSGGGDIHYSTDAGGGTRNELWDFGLSKYADATDARLSLDDVCPPGEYIRADVSAYLTSPNPTEHTPSED